MPIRTSGSSRPCVNSISRDSFAGHGAPCLVPPALACDLPAHLQGPAEQGFHENPRTTLSIPPVSRGYSELRTFEPNRCRARRTLSNPARNSSISRFAPSRNSCTSPLSQPATQSATAWARDCPASVTDAPAHRGAGTPSGMFDGAVVVVTASRFEGGGAAVCASSGVGFIGLTVATESDRSATGSLRSGEVGTLAGVAGVEVGDGGGDTAASGPRDASGTRSPAARRPSRRSPRAAPASAPPISCPERLSARSPRPAEQRELLDAALV